MFKVKIKYQYPYVAYEREQTMRLDELYVVEAETQRVAIQKTENFIREQCGKSKLEVTEVSSIEVQTSQASIFISGFIT